MAGAKEFILTSSEISEREQPFRTHENRSLN
jgi:hypothetical protein